MSTCTERASTVSINLKSIVYVETEGQLQVVNEMYINEVHVVSSHAARSRTPAQVNSIGSCAGTRKVNWDRRKQVTEDDKKL